MWQVSGEMSVGSNLVAPSEQCIPVFTLVYLQLLCCMPMRREPNPTWPIADLRALPQTLWPLWGLSTSVAHSVEGQWLFLLWSTKLLFSPHKG